MLKMKNRFSSKNLFGEKNVHAVFELSLLLKASLAMMEIIAGVLTYFVTPQFLLNTLHRITQVSFIESRGDIIAIICCMRPNISPLVAYISLRHICLSTVPLSYGLLLGCGAKNSVITLLLWRFLVCLLFINSIAIPLLILCF